MMARPSSWGSTWIRIHTLLERMASSAGGKRQRDPDERPHSIGLLRRVIVATVTSATFEFSWGSTAIFHKLSRCCLALLWPWLVCAWRGDERDYSSSGAGRCGPF